ncbi:pectoralis alpha actinin [Capsaspora owczarzaki ATCC 30864]|nr:pectoralis alpha actinin [Capsaspora owczarzaki ATCC 30864]|eukprot:XP_004349304.2 pectoralis alpha actinin [Capsaspora owczarzaki ATCC 30864]
MSEGVPADQQEPQVAKLLLDDAWERQQRKTFTAWCNANLGKAGIKIEDITVDFNDGVKLLKLLEIISGDKLPKPETGKMRLHKIQNINKGFDFLKSKNVKLVGIGAEEICDGNLKMTLGMIWTIILRFQIQDISVEEMSAKEGLLLWCQRKTKGYRGVNIQNFHVSFKDGLAFAALIHRHRPETIDYDSLKIGDAAVNLNLAFDVAERDIGIPKMLDPEDMINTPKPDERSVMTYVAAYYHAFASSQKNEIAARRIGKLLDFEQEIGALIDEYDRLVTSLLAWIQQSISRLSERDFGNSIQGVQNKLSEFRDYRVSERPPKSAEKSKLESSFSTIQTKLRLKNRPSYQPAADKTIHAVLDAWKNLEAAEKEHESALRHELIRQEKLEALAAKFAQKAAIFESWADGKDQYLSSADVGDSLASVAALLKQHSAFEADLAARAARVEGIQTAGQELISENYSGAQAVSDRVNASGDSYASLQRLSADRRARLEESERRQKALDELRFDFARKAAAFANWHESAKEDLLDSFKVYSIDEINDLQSRHEQYKLNLANPEAELEQLRGLASQLAAEGVSDNPYTTLTVADVEQFWSEIQALAVQRDADIATETGRQNDNEQLRLEYAANANSFGEWLQTTNATLAQGATGTSEEQLQFLQAQQATLQGEEARLQQIEEINQRIEQAVILENKHSNFPIESIRENWESVHTLLQRSLNTLNNQILTRDMSGLTEEQIQEYRQSYSHFDKDNSGRLDRLEFRACLLSTGYSLPEVKAGEADPTYDAILAKVDPDGQGYVEFDRFVDFMRNENADTDSADQIIESFRVIAGGKDYVTADELRRDLPPVQAEYVISRAPAHPSGGLDYVAYVRSVY